VIAIAGALALAAAALAVAVLSAVAGRNPDRAAMLVVLSAAAGGIATFGLGVLGSLVLGLAPPRAVGVMHGVVHYVPQRVTAGLVFAAVLVAVAAWLIRTGDWRRPDG
jgi:hypothetical protein